MTRRLSTSYINILKHVRIALTWRKRNSFVPRQIEFSSTYNPIFLGNLQLLCFRQRQIRISTRRDLPVNLAKGVLRALYLQILGRLRAYLTSYFAHAFSLIISAANIRADDDNSDESEDDSSSSETNKSTENGATYMELYMSSQAVKEECLGWAARDPSGVLSPYKFSRRDVRSDDVFLSITHCGVCYADVALTRNKLGHSKYPLLPGHEIVVSSDEQQMTGLACQASSNVALDRVIIKMMIEHTINYVEGSPLKGNHCSSWPPKESCRGKKEEIVMAKKATGCKTAVSGTEDITTSIIDSMAA
ncbi:hypothetical protein LguiB_006099 [Lonicera macranthoides]